MTARSIRSPAFQELINVIKRLRSRLRENPETMSPDDYRKVMAATEEILELLNYSDVADALMQAETEIMSDPVLSVKWQASRSQP